MKTKTIHQYNHDYTSLFWRFITHSLASSLLFVGGRRKQSSSLSEEKKNHRVFLSCKEKKRTAFPEFLIAAAGRTTFIPVVIKKNKARSVLLKL
jgi:hypothetical protein